MPTGQLATTPGGSLTFQKLSGTAAGNAVIASGQGRFDAIMFHASPAPSLASGVVQTIADAVSLASGLGGTGGTVLFKFHPAQSPGATLPLTFLSGAANFGSNWLACGARYFSGLCHDSASGQIGFTVQFTPGPTP